MKASLHKAPYRKLLNEPNPEFSQNRSNLEFLRLGNSRKIAPIILHCVLPFSPHSLRSHMNLRIDILHFNEKAIHDEKK
jgi:hypothetical protein